MTIVAILSLVAFVVQTVRIERRRHFGFVKGINVIKGIVLPEPDDARWVKGAIVIPVPHPVTGNFHNANAVVYNLGGINVTFRNSIHQETFNTYQVEIMGGEKFEGFTVKRYWKAIHRQYTKRLAAKTIESPEILQITGLVP